MIYHIVAEKVWRDAERAGEYIPDTLSAEGFIHASTEPQVGRSAENYFKGVPDLVLLSIDEGRLRAELVWENTVGGDEPFPHLYGALNLDAVVKVEPLAVFLAR